MDAKKKNKRRILAAGALVAAVCAAAVPVSGYLSGLNSRLPEASSSEEAVAESAVAGVITDAEIEGLLSGETTLDELESKLAAAAPDDETAGSEAESEDEPASERVSGKAASEQSDSASASSSKVLAASGSSSSSKAASSETASSKDTSSKAASSKTAASSSASSAADETPAYEAEVKTQIQELYVLRAQALKDLDSNIESARAEYHALPEEQQTTVRKVSIAFSRAGQLTKLQSYYDKEVDRIVGEMRTTLEANGQSTELADEAMASYKKQKSEMYSSLMAKLYK